MIKSNQDFIVQQPMHNTDNAMHYKINIFKLSLSK